MKNLVITAALVLASLFNAFAMEDGHVLTDLWRRYEDARREDRPQKEAEILSEIKAEALRKHLPVDFYDASTKYVNTVLRRDWKQGDKLREDLEADVKRLNHPLVTFLWMKEWKRASQEELWTFVKEHPKGFEGYNPALYRGVEGFLNGALKPFIRTDREFVLWNLLQARRYASPEQEEIYKVLKEELDGRYPSDGALEYWMLSRKSFSREELPLKRQALQALRSQYAGKALALFPEADWLLMDKEELDLRKAGGKEYKALSEACKRFEWVRKNFTGEEATLAKACTGVEYLLQQLESQDLDVRVEKGRAQVIFRNLYHANLTLRQGKKTLQTWKVVNFDESYYAQDTVSVDLPQLPDGAGGCPGPKHLRGRLQERRAAVFRNPEAPERRPGGGIGQPQAEWVHPSSQSPGRGHEGEFLLHPGSRVWRAPLAGPGAGEKNHAAYPERQPHPL